MIVADDAQGAAGQQFAHILAPGGHWGGQALDEDKVSKLVRELVPEGLWQRVQLLLPQRPPRRFRDPGRLPRKDRAALAGIVHDLITGCTWGQVPTEQFGCSGVTCWRRLRDWTEAGVWTTLHQVLLDELRAAGKLQLNTAVVYGSHVRALKGELTPALHQ